ncbi:MAG TPA: ligand-binding protein SH3 [Firmicutes bacterium]|nr:ligand-binding protein SH3 [Bacillota bacterium]
MLELRASIPYGFLAGVPLWLLLPVVIAVNWLVAPVVYLFLRYLLRGLLHWGWFSRLWERYTARVQKRAEKAVATWGAFGLALFIGIPLPGSGVYTGALGAYLLGMGFRRFMWVALAGVCIAAAAVTLIMVTGSELFKWMLAGRH